MHPLEMRIWKNTPATFVNNWANLENEISEYNNDKLLEIHKKMKRCWDDYFSPKAVSDFIIQTIRGEHVNK